MGGSGAKTWVRWLAILPLTLPIGAAQAGAPPAAAGVAAAAPAASCVGPPFGAPVEFELVGELSLQGVAVGDFNADGTPDVAVVGGAAFAGVPPTPGAGAVSVLLGDGAGGLGPARKFPVGRSPRGVATGDFNGDGRADLVVSHHSADGLALLLGAGDGTFAPPTTVDAGWGALAVGDFDRDGRPDVAVVGGANRDDVDSTVAVYLGKGNGTFRPRASYPAGKGSDAMALGDFNADGHPDLAVGNSIGNTVSVLLGAGDGTFRPDTEFPAGPEPRAVAVGDFDGDGTADIAVANKGSELDPEEDHVVAILLGDGRGGFGAPAQGSRAPGRPRSLATGDFNGDGRLDVAHAGGLAGRVSVRLGAGNGGLGPPAVWEVRDVALAVAPADLNRDGRPDLVVASSTVNCGPHRGAVAVLAGTGCGAPPPIGGTGFTLTDEPTGPELAWTGGVAQVGFSLVRVAGGAATPLPAGGAPLPAWASSYTDPAPPPRQLTCYVLVPLSRAGALGLSDMLCLVPGARSAQHTAPPEHFTLRLDQSRIAALRWAYTSWSGFRLTAIPLDGGPWRHRLLPPVTTATADTRGIATCYLLSMPGGSIAGVHTVPLCGVPGVSTLEGGATGPAGGAPLSREAALARAREAVRALEAPARRVQEQLDRPE